MSLGAASKVWREKLVEEIKVPELSQAFDINKYYHFATEVFKQADEADTINNLSHAYIKYKQYIRLANEVIMKHNYYKHYKNKRLEFNTEYRVVVDRLENVVQRMDEAATHHVAEMQALEAKRLKEKDEEVAKKRAEILKEQQRQAAAIQARANAELAAQKASQDAIFAQNKEKELQRLADIERNKAAEVALKRQELQNDNEVNLLTSTATSTATSTTSTATSSNNAIYCHQNGQEENVQIVKAHSESEGGGYTIFIPSLNRERMTEANRLKFQTKDIHGDLLGLGDQSNHTLHSLPSSSSCLPCNQVTVTPNESQDTGLSLDDLNILSNDSNDYDSNSSSSSSSHSNKNHHNNGSAAYPGVPNPSWMPESSGEAHRVVIPPPPPPPTSSLIDLSNNHDEKVNKNDDEEDLLLGLSKPTSKPVPVVLNEPPIIEKKQQSVINHHPSAPPAYDFDDQAIDINEEVNHNSPQTSSLSLTSSSVITQDSHGNPSPSLISDPFATDENIFDSLSKPTSKPTPITQPPLSVAPVRPPVAQPPPNRNSHQTQPVIPPKPSVTAPPPPAAAAAAVAVKPKLKPKPYGEEEEEESLADLLAAAATAASKPIAVPPAPIPTPVAASSHSSGASSHSNSMSTSNSLSMSQNGFGSVYSTRQLKAETERQWTEMLRSGRANITYLGTYQGVRRSGGDSTNGCTVIAPLIGFRHIKWTNPRLPNSHIEHVIDNDCPPILSQIRAKFSLPNGSFVVPADVHDYLFDRKLLEVHHYLPSLFSLCLYLYLSLSFL